MKDNTIIVHDLGNYKDEFKEPTPFKGVVLEKYDTQIIVKSLSTNKEYEIYTYQCLEGLELSDIKSFFKK